MISSSTKENTETIPKKYVINTWDDEHLSLKIPLLRGIYAFGFEKPSSIQKKKFKPITTNPNK